MRAVVSILLPPTPGHTSYILLSTEYRRPPEGDFREAPCIAIALFCLCGHLSYNFSLEARAWIKGCTMLSGNRKKWLLELVLVIRDVHVWSTSLWPPERTPCRLLLLGGSICRFKKRFTDFEYWREGWRLLDLVLDGSMGKKGANWSWRRGKIWLN